MKLTRGIVPGVLMVISLTVAACGAPVNAGNSPQAGSQPPAANSGSANTGGSAAQGQSNPNGSAAGANQGGQNGGGRFNSANFLAGQVKQVSGGKITLTAANGVDETIDVASGAQIEKTVSGALSDFQPGQRITVQGNRESDGTMTAQTIRIVPAGNGPTGNGPQNGPNAQATPRARRTPGANPNGGGQNGNGQFNPANFTTGLVKQISGSTITLTAANGVDETVNVGSQAQIEKTVPGALSDIQPGDRVTAQGTRAADGAFTAQMIQLGGAFGPGFGGARGAGPGAGQGGNMPQAPTAPATGG